MKLLSAFAETVPDDPFYQPRKPLWLPREMSIPVPLPSPGPTCKPQPRTALLINPFYAEDYARRVRIFHENGTQVNGSFVVGFDGDRKDTFSTLAQWIESNRMECATFHILTPYPGTPLFRQMEAEGRLLHRDWEKYDTAHVVFRPKHLTPDELLLGYDWLYRRLFSHASIWRRRPVALSALPAYLAGCYLYKRSNRLWRFLIKHRLVHAVWQPLVELTRLRHLNFRPRLAAMPVVGDGQAFANSCSTPFPASV